jgi:putative membrane protein
MPETEPHPSRTDLAEERTEWAEDRTLLANERTFAGWLRTGLAAVGVGVGFHALFGELDPPYLARGVATVFILTGVFVFMTSAFNANKVCARLRAHSARPLGGASVNLIAGLLSVASMALLAGIWLLAKGSTDT